MTLSKAGVSMSGAGVSINVDYYHHMSYHMLYEVRGILGHNLRVFEVVGGRCVN